jgi:hypothetical protein
MLTASSDVAEAHVYVCARIAADREVARVRSIEGTNVALAPVRQRPRSSDLGGGKRSRLSTSQRLPRRKAKYPMHFPRCCGEQLERSHSISRILRWQSATARSPWRRPRDRRTSESGSRAGSQAAGPPEIGVAIPPENGTDRSVHRKSSSWARTQSASQWLATLPREVRRTAAHRANSREMLKCPPFPVARRTLGGSVDPCTFRLRTRSRSRAARSS